MIRCFIVIVRVEKRESNVLELASLFYTTVIFFEANNC